MNYSDSILMTEISETTPLVFATSKTLHERFTKKPQRCVFIIKNGFTTKFRYNRLKDRVVFQNRKGLKISKRFSTYDQGNEKGIENKDASNNSSYESNGELSSISGNGRVVFMPEDFKEDCSTVRHDMKQDDGSDGTYLKHSSSIKSEEHLSTISDDRRVVLMPSDFEEDCAVAKHDIEIADGSDGKCLEHSSSNDKSDEDLGTITDKRSVELMASDFEEVCTTAKHDMEIADGSDGKYLEFFNGNDKSDEDLSTITDNRSVVAVPNDFREDCSSEKHDMEIANGSDGNCLEYFSSNDESNENLGTITDNRSVVLMPSDFREDCPAARHDMEIADGSDGKYLEFFNSNDKSDDDLITITDNRSVVTMPSDFREDSSSEKHDMEIADGSDSIYLEYSSSDSKSVEELDTITDNRSIVLMTSDFREDCSAERHDIEIASGSDSRCLEHFSRNDKSDEDLITITDNRSAVFMPRDFLEGFSKAKHGMEIAGGSDSRCLKHSSINYKSNEDFRAITDNKRVVSMPSDLKDDCSIVKHDMEQDNGSDSRCLNHSSSNHKWNKGLRTITDNKRVVSMSSNLKKYCPTVNHDSDDASEPIIFKPYMLKSYNRCERQSFSKRSASERDSSKRSPSKMKRYKPSKKDLDNEIDTYMAKIKFKHIVKSGDSSEDIDSFVN